MGSKLRKNDILVYLFSIFFLGGIFWLFYQVYQVYSEDPTVDETWIETVGTNLRPYSGRSSANLFEFNVYDSTLRRSRRQEAYTDITSYNNAKGDKYLIKYYPKDPSNIYVLQDRPIFLASEIENGEVVITKAIISREPYQANITFNKKNKIYNLEYRYLINERSVTKIQALPTYLNKEMFHKGDSFDVWVWKRNIKRAILILEDKDKYIYYDN